MEVSAWRFSPHVSTRVQNAAFAVQQETQSRLDLLPASGMSWSLPALDSLGAGAEEHVSATVTLLRPAETVTDPVGPAAHPFHFC